MALRTAGIKEESAKYFCTAFFKVNKDWILFLEILKVQEYVKTHALFNLYILYANNENEIIIKIMHEFIMHEGMKCIYILISFFLSFLHDAVFS